MLKYIFYFQCMFLTANGLFAQSIEPVKIQPMNIPSQEGIGTMEYVDVKYGFKNISLGENISEVQKLYKVIADKENKGVTNYTLIDAKFKKVGECNLSEAWLVVFQGKVMSIFLRTSAAIESSCMLQTLQSLFGKGFQDNQYIERYSWFGKKCLIVYDENSVDNSAVITIDSKPIRDSYEAFEKKQAQTNGSDF
jgi:hypothetical protein